MAMSSNPAPFQDQHSLRISRLSGSSCPPSLGISHHGQFVPSSSPPHSFPGASLTDSQLDNGGGTKKRVWNKPSNDPVAAEVTGAVMGADSWPSLPESARASPKSPLKALSQPSVAVSQEMPVGTLSSPKDVGSGLSNPGPNGHNVGPSRQRSMKHDGSGGNSSHSGMSANDNLSQTPPTQGAVAQAPPTQGAVVETTPPGPVKPGGWVRESSSRDSGQRGGFYGGNEVHPQQHGSFRRNNSGPLFRGDGGSNHRNVGGKRDQHAHRRSVGSRPFLNGASPNAPFIPHPPSQGVVRPFVTSMVYGEMPSSVVYVSGPHSDSLRSMAMVPIPSMFFPPMLDPYLHCKIVNQIDYYFSNGNLVKDIFLRKNMDNEGWVPINLIAGFTKVMELTDNIQLILHSIQASNVVEVKGDKVRRKHDWIKWIMPPPIESIITSPRSIIEPSQSMLATHLHSVTLGGKAAI